MIKYFKLILLMFIGVAMSAQTTVKGTVVDSESGLPVPGASVKVVGTMIGVASDFDGEFSLVVDQQPPFDLEA
jgi:hypothetical protein